MPNIQFINCTDTPMSANECRPYNECLIVTFTSKTEYAGLTLKPNSTRTYRGKLYNFDGTLNVDSRVVATLHTDENFALVNSALFLSGSHNDSVCVTHKKV